MYFIEKEKDLLGKKIIFTHFAQFADAITIVTEDKGVFVCDKDLEEIEIYRSHYARKYILDSEYLRKELNRLDIITKEDLLQYQLELEEKYQKDLKIRQKQTEERERKEFLRLQEIYGNSTVE